MCTIGLDLDSQLHMKLLAAVYELSYLLLLEIFWVLPRKTLEINA